MRTSAPTSALLRVYVWLVFAFLMVPMLVVIPVAFTSEAYVRFPPIGFSLRWFAAVWSGSTFIRGIINSLELATLATGISMVLGVPAAMALVRLRLRRAKLIESFLLSPLALPMIIIGTSLLFTFGALGLGLSFWGLLVGHIIITVPYIVRTVAGVYRGVDHAIEEAAKVLGADSLRLFTHITLPLIKPGILAGAIFAFVFSFDNLPISMFLSSAETTTLPVAILSYLVYNYDPSVAAISVMEMAFVVIALFFAERVSGLGYFTSFGG